MEWLNGLAPDIQSQVTHFMYDDMCHLKVKINCNYFDFLPMYLISRNMHATPDPREVSLQPSLLAEKCVWIICISSMI